MFKLMVLCCVLAGTSASSILGGHLAPITTLAYATPLWQPSNYRGPLSLAPGQPASILGADGRPLDTLEVNLDKSAHFASKLLNNEIHVFKKRSAPLTTFLKYTTSLIQPYNYRGPLSLAPGQPANILGADSRPLDTLDVNLDRAYHYANKALNGVHFLKKRSAPINAITIARTPLIAPAYSYITPVTATHLNPITYNTAYITQVL